MRRMIALSPIVSLLAIACSGVPETITPPSSIEAITDPCNGCASKVAGDACGLNGVCTPPIAGDKGSPDLQCVDDCESIPPDCPNFTCENCTNTTCKP